MESKVRELITKTLNSLHFVRWDRFVDVTVEDQSVTLYGWIAREKDSKSDFVTLTYYLPTHPLYEGFTFVTSSKIYSEQISNILDAGDTDGGEHKVCQRIEDTFTECKNVIRLQGEQA